jgi:hypothetical protein
MHKRVYTYIYVYFRTRPDRLWGPPSLLYNGYRVSFPGVKRPGRGVEYPPHLAPTLKKEYIYTSTPPLGLRGLFYIYIYIYIYIYRVSQEECASLREGVPYVKVHRYNPKHLYPKLNGYVDNGQRKVWSSGGSTHCTCLIYVTSLSVVSYDGRSAHVSHKLHIG